ncbi:MAG: EFR1 family ferrodoxin [Atopobiaceae bacterium]|nr:EFR1 family ferrodoxin [Atopobiaceae bacterium]
MVNLVTFSPTGASLDVAKILGEELSPESTLVDLCEREGEERAFGPDDTCVFSVPCYGGRIPAVAVERLARVRGDHTPAIVCVTFGNRAFEDALLELADLVEERDFSVVAGCAAVTEHNVMHVFGTGRPDQDDVERLRAFARSAADKIATGDDSRPDIPGCRPYKTWGGMHVTIDFVADTCTTCGLCARRCPVGAISDDAWPADQDRCISCMRCIKECPTGSRRFPEATLEGMVTRLGPACEAPKENVFFV